MSAALTVRDFFRQKYFLTLIAVLTFTISINLFVGHLSVDHSAQVVGSNITETLLMNRNEFLDEIALKDFDAIRQHLSILRGRLRLDKLSLRLSNDAFSAERPAEEISFLVKALRPVFQVEPIEVRIANDYGKFPSTLKANFEDALLDSTALPLLQQLLITNLGVLLIISLIFTATYAQIRNRLLQPIAELSNYFKLKTSNPLPEPSGDELAEIKELLDGVRSYDALRQKQLIGEVAAQVAHDIRSPLSALSMVSQDLPNVPEERRAIIRSAIQRIQEIAANLIDSQKQVFGHSSPPVADDGVLLTSTLDSLVQEKQAQYGNASKARFTFVPPANGWNASVFARETDLNRVLSNLLDNAAQSLGTDGGTVNVSFRVEHPCVVISVKDNGIGIPAEKLPFLFERGSTFKKTGGVGLGLSNAKTLIESWGGSIAIQSTEGKGTEVSVRLKSVSTPAWLASEIRIPASRQVVVVDDEQTVHEEWKRRFSEIGIVPISLYKITELENKKDALLSVSALFLIDYEFYGASANGLDAIEKLGLAPYSILVTGHVLREEITHRAGKLGVKVLLKGLTAHIPFET